MKALIKKGTILISFMFLLSSSLFGQNNCEYPRDDEWFSFCIEQNGSPVHAENNSIVLSKGPFTLVLVTRGPVGVLVNASDEDTLYRGFLKNLPLAKIIEEPDMFMGIGEAPLNPDELLLIDKQVPHYFYYSDPTSHRYSTTEQRREWVIGRREISNYTTYSDDFAPIPIENLEADVLYLSLMYGEYDKDYNQIELQKEALKISFQ